MHRAIAQFEDNFSRIRNIDAVYNLLFKTYKLPASDVGDILRSELVYAVAALDKLIHEIVRKGMVSTFTGVRFATPGYLSYQLTMGQFNTMNSTGHLPPEAVFEQCVMTSHGFLAFQEPGKITEALNLIWLESQKWNKIAAKLGLNEADVKVELKNIVTRRNQIVHESDIDMVTEDVRPIIYSDIIDAISFIEKLGKAIFDLVK